MALLAFEIPNMLRSPNSAPSVSTTTTSAAAKLVPEPSMPSSIASLLDQSQRLKTAAELNAAILTSQSHCKDPKLPGMMKMLSWGESLLTDKGAEFPRCKFDSKEVRLNVCLTFLVPF